MNSNIKISIAIVTRNRPESLSATLRSMAVQSKFFFEVVISDDSSDPESITANKLLADEYNCRYVSGPQKGLYANRNFVAMQCTGTHIRTMDDDHTFPEFHMEHCLKAVEAEPETIWTIGEYSARVDYTPAKPYPVPGQLHPKGYSYSPFEDDLSVEYYGISCGGTIYPRKVLSDKVMNADFYKFGGLYLEYGARLNYLGYKIKWLDTTYIIHNDTVTTATQLSSDVINGARLYSILCLSLLYKPQLSNKIQTFSQIAKLMFSGEVSLKLLTEAYRNVRKTKESLHH